MLIVFCTSCSSSGLKHLYTKNRRVINPTLKILDKHYGEFLLATTPINKHIEFTPIREHNLNKYDFLSESELEVLRDCFKIFDTITIYYRGCYFFSQDAEQELLSLYSNGVIYCESETCRNVIVRNDEVVKEIRVGQNIIIVRIRYPFG